MVVDAKERFLQRMANVINVAANTDTPAQMQERFSGHENVDIKKAQALAARARAEAMKRQPR